LLHRCLYFISETCQLWYDTYVYIYRSARIPYQTEICQINFRKWKPNTRIGIKSRNLSAQPCCLLPIDKMNIGLELNHLSLPLLVSSKFEMFAALQRDLLADFAFSTLHPQHDFLGSLSLLPEDGFCLTTITLLLSVVTTTALGSGAFLRLFVLRNFVVLVGLAFFAVGTATLRYVHL